MSSGERDGWMTLAIVLLGVGMLVGFTFAGLNRQAINDQQHRFQTQTTEDIAAAKAAAIAAADAETLRKVCGLVAAIPDPPISTRYALALGCPPSVATDRGPATSSARPAPSPSVPPAGTVHTSGSGQGSTGGTATSLPTPGQPTRPPSSSPSPRPSMSPTSPALLCLLTVCVG